MSKVTIAPSKEGNLVTPYDNAPEYGYIILAQTKSSFVNGWLKESTNRTIMKGSVTSLEKFVQSNPNLSIAGKLVVSEYLEDEVPEAVASAHFDKSLTFEEQISNYIKRAGTDGPELTAGGKRILRFVMLDSSATQVDSLIAHDNGDAVKAFNAAAAKKSATLPK